MLRNAKDTLCTRIATCREKDACSTYVKRRLPILGWLPRYRLTWFPQDMLAGITVGLTAIPQGIAYGVVAGLSPEYGLYSAFMASFVYILVGSCENITIGPTAIMATMARPLVEGYGPDMAVLLAFLKGCIITLLGIFHLGFLLDFISLPVIAGFTSAAAISIASSQFKPLLGIRGKSDGFLNTVIDVFKHIREVRYQDSVLGVATIAILVLLKNIPGQRNGNWVQKIGWSLTLSRNAIVVVAGTVIAYVMHTYGKTPFDLTGSMGHGLPPFAPPPFSTTYRNNTYDFLEMTKAMGTTLFTMPLVSTIEHIAIAKAFAKGRSLDGTQEMIAVGLSNVFGSFVRSMPVTGSFTRTAVNHASGVKTPLGGLFTGGLVMLAAGLLTSTFRFIPKATLAGVIICAMYYMLDFKVHRQFWLAKKLDYILLLLTLLTCLFLGLEMGIIIGIAINILILLYDSTRPAIETKLEQVEGQTVMYVTPKETIAFPAAENLRAQVMRLYVENPSDVILDCRNLKRIDVTVAKNIKLLAGDIKIHGQQLICINCNENVNKTLESIAPGLSRIFKEDEV